MNNSRNNENKEMNAQILSWLSRILVAGACLALVMMITLQSCHKTRRPEGTYVNTAGSEFSIAHDTLVVEHDENQRYFLHRSTGFRLLDDSGKAGALQYEKEEWAAVYDPQTEVMTESRKGKQISFNTDKDTMTVGKRRYKRIK